MKKAVIGVVVAVVVLVAIGALMHDGATNQAKENKVGATIFPVYDIAREVAGDEFEVVLMLPSGTSPHTFDPQPSLLKDLQGTQVVFAIGHGLDNWATGLAESVDAPVVTVDEGIELRETEESHDEHGHEDEHNADSHEGTNAHEDEHGHKEADKHDDEHGHEDEHADEHKDDHDGHEDEGKDDRHDEHGHEDEHHGHNHGPIDPHYWLSVHNAEKIAMTIAHKLGELDEENAALYEQRAENYAAELETLAEELEAQAAGLSERNIVSLHDAWYYFADAFGLNIIGTFEPAAGREPTPQYLANLEEEVVENNVTTIFLEPQLSSASIEAFASDNNLGIAVIDPIGGVAGRESYIELMRYNVTQVIEALTR